MMPRIRKAMLALEIASKYAHVLAGAVPAAAGALYGYWKPPVAPIPLMDIHGLYDDTIPANITNSHRYDINGNSGAPAGCGFSSDGFYYVPSYNFTRDIAKVNGCEMSNAEGWNTTTGSWIPWETSIDGTYDQHTTAGRRPLRRQHLRYCVRARVCVRERERGLQSFMVVNFRVLYADASSNSYNLHTAGCCALRRTSRVAVRSRIWNVSS